jgi:small-conductance mechanosensitive channel
MPTWDTLLAAAILIAEAWVPRVAVAMAVLLMTWQVALWARRSFQRAAGRTRADANAQAIVGRLVYGATWTVGLIWLLLFLGVDHAGILTTFGAVSLALGLAIQDVLRSFFAGLYLLFERPFVIGDEIEVKDKVGRVEEVGFRATTIRMDDNTVLVVPNSIIFSEVVRNRSAAQSQVSPGETPPEPEP